jgi:hypothetical protein
MPCSLLWLFFFFSHAQDSKYARKYDQRIPVFPPWTFFHYCCMYYNSSSLSNHHSHSMRIYDLILFSDNFPFYPPFSGSHCSHLLMRLLGPLCPVRSCPIHMHPHPYKVPAFSIFSFETKVNPPHVRPHLPLLFLPPLSPSRLASSALPARNPE